MPMAVLISDRFCRLSATISCSRTTVSNIVLTFTYYIPIIIIIIIIMIMIMIMITMIMIMIMIIILYFRAFKSIYIYSKAMVLFHKPFSQDIVSSFPFRHKKSYIDSNHLYACHFGSGLSGM